MSFKTKAQRQAEFESAPRSPKEIKDFEAEEARWDGKAQDYFARQVAFQAERYTAAVSRINDITYAMSVGGAKTVPGRRSVAEHMSDIARLRAELDKAEAEAVEAAEAVAALQGRDPVAMFEATVHKYPALRDRLS